MNGEPAALRRELVRLAWPIAVSTISYAVMSLADTLFVGQIGTSELAGVALGSTAFFTVICFGMGLLKGAKVLISQAVGRGDAEDAARYASAALWLAGALAIVTTVAGLAISEALPSISVGPSGLDARAYTRIRSFGALPLMVYFALREARYGYGDSKTPMHAVLVGNGLNIVLDAVFIFGFGWGVPGAAWATVIAGVVQSLWLGRARSRVPADRRAVAEAWRIGVPTAIQFSLEVGSFALLAALLAGLGERALGAHQIALQVIHFGFLPLLAVSEAASVMAGHAVGASRADLVQPTARKALELSVAYAACFTLVLLFLAEPMVAAFTPDPALRAVAVSLLRVAIVIQLADAANVIARGVLRGTGDVTYPAIVAIVTAWVCIPPLTWLFGYQLGLGAVGGWMGIAVECTVGALVLWRRLLQGPRSEVPRVYSQASS